MAAPIVAMRLLKALAGAALAGGLWSGGARGEPLPQAVAEMIAAAADDPETLEAVARIAKRTNPKSLSEIDAQVAELRARTPAARRAEAPGTSGSQGWKGKGELGGAMSTGNTDQESLALGLELERDSRRWWHSVDASADLQREDQELTKERYFLALATHYKISRRWFLVGVLWGEGDRFAGYDSRVSESLGLGYRLIDRPGLKLRIEGGPALRQADYVDTGVETSASFRAAEYLSWTLAPGSEFTQRAVGYIESGNSTLIGSTALTSRLYDAVSARASFEVRYESQPPRGRENTDTTTRLTVVYSF